MAENGDPSWRRWWQALPIWRTLTALFFSSTIVLLYWLGAVEDAFRGGYSTADGGTMAEWVAGIGTVAAVVFAGRQVKAELRREEAHREEERRQERHRSQAEAFAAACTLDLQVEVEPMPHRPGFWWHKCGFWVLVPGFTPTETVMHLRLVLRPYGPCWAREAVEPTFLPPNQLPDHDADYHDVFTYRYPTLLRAGIPVPPVKIAMVPRSGQYLSYDEQRTDTNVVWDHFLGTTVVVAGWRDLRGYQLSQLVSPDSTPLVQEAEGAPWDLSPDAPPDLARLPTVGGSEEPG